MKKIATVCYGHLTRTVHRISFRNEANYDIATVNHDSRETLHDTRGISNKRRNEDEVSINLRIFGQSKCREGCSGKPTEKFTQLKMPSFWSCSLLSWHLTARKTLLEQRSLIWFYWNEGQICESLDLGTFGAFVVMTKGHYQRRIHFKP